MTRTLHSLLILAMITVGGCSQVKALFSSDDSQLQVKDDSRLKATEPEGLQCRTWSATEVTYGEFDSIDGTPYFNSYENLDKNYQNKPDTSAWSKSNAKKAIFDPFLTLKDAVIAPFMYSRDKYNEHKANKAKDDSDCPMKSDKSPCGGKSDQIK